MKLSETKLKALRPSEKPYQVADGHGLVVEVQPGGTLSWVYRYRYRGRGQSVRLGQYPITTLREAREKRLEAARELAKGKSPAAEKQATKQALSARMTIREVAQIYLEEIVRRDRKDATTIERYFCKEIYPTIGSLLPGDVTPKHILAITDRMKSRSVPMAALDCRNLLKRFFDFAIARQIATFNPVASIPAKMVAVARSRERTLSPDELKIYLTKLYQSDIQRRYKLAFHLILLTLVRKSELVLAKWSEVDLDAREWRIPPENNKIGKEKTIYLSTQAKAMFEALKTSADNSDYVLPGRNKPGQPVSKTVLNTTLRALEFGIPHFTIHDSRRTASTLLHEMGWSSDVIEKALGHELGGVRGIYNRAQYADQRKQMLQQWADFVDRVMTERKVIIANFRCAA